MPAPKKQKSDRPFGGARVIYIASREKVEKESKQKDETEWGGDIIQRPRGDDGEDLINVYDGSIILIKGKHCLIRDLDRI